MIEHKYSFLHDEDGTMMPELEGVDLPVLPRSGERLRIVYDAIGDVDGYLFDVISVTHNLLRSFSGEWTQVVDVTVRPVT